MKNITGFYRNWRVKNHISMDTIALQTGVSKAAIQKFETGCLKSANIECKYNDIIKNYSGTPPIYETTYRCWRYENGYTLHEIADYIGVSHQAVWLFECGKLNSDRIKRGFDEFIEKRISK